MRTSPESYETTAQYRDQRGTGQFKLTNDFEIEPYSGIYVRDINFTPDDRRLPDQAICRVFSNRRDAEKIFAAIQ